MGLAGSVHPYRRKSHGQFEEARRFVPDPILRGHEAKTHRLGRIPLQIAKEQLRQFESARLRSIDNPLPTKTPLAEILQAYVEHVRGVKMPADRNPAAAVERYKERAPEIRYLTLTQTDEQPAALTHYRAKAVAVQPQIHSFMSAPPFLMACAISPSVPAWAQACSKTVGTFAHVMHDIRNMRVLVVA